jgi:hypothetical protein
VGRAIGAAPAGSRAFAVSIVACDDAAGIYCIRLYDTGTLTAPAAFSVTIVRP